MTQQIHIQQVSIALATMLFVGCKGPEHGGVPLGGTEDTGITVPDLDLPTEDEPPLELPPGQCTQRVEECFGEVQLDFVATYNNKQFTGGDILRFDPGETNPKYWVDPDSYELPLVAPAAAPSTTPTPRRKKRSPMSTIASTTWSSRSAWACPTSCER